MIISWIETDRKETEVDVMSLTTGILLSIAFLQFHDQRNLGG
jgi:hypothetical protein